MRTSCRSRHATSTRIARPRTSIPSTASPPAAVTAGDRSNAVYAQRFHAIVFNDLAFRPHLADAPRVASAVARRIARSGSTAAAAQHDLRDARGLARAPRTGGSRSSACRASARPGSRRCCARRPTGSTTRSISASAPATWASTSSTTSSARRCGTRSCASCCARTRSTSPRTSPSRTSPRSRPTSASPATRPRAASPSTSTCAASASTATPRSPPPATRWLFIAQGRGHLRLPTISSATPRARSARWSTRSTPPTRCCAISPRATLPVWIRGTEADLEALARRFDRAPKPMYYPEDFLTELWAGYLAAEGVAPDAVDPDAFIRHGFRALMAHRLPRYAEMADALGRDRRGRRGRRGARPGGFRRAGRRGARRRRADEPTSTRPRHDHAQPRALHGHGHGHGHAHSAHAANARAVGIAALLTGGFMVAEVIGGLLAGSLALLADAGHMLTDFAALAMAWLAFRVARRPADAARTYGFDRLSVLAAFVNGLALFVVAAWIVVEAVAPARRPAAGRRRDDAGGRDARAPRQHRSPSGSCRAATAANLNLRAALLHVARRPARLGRRHRRGAGDPRTGWTPIDPILSVLVSLLILRSAWTRGARQRPHPARGDARRTSTPRAVAADLAASVPGVAEVRHLHAWSISEARPMVTLEAVIRPRAATPRPRAGRSRRGSPNASASTTPRSRSAPRPAEAGGLPAAGCRLSRRARLSREAPECRSRSPRPCPPTTCCVARASWSCRRRRRCARTSARCRSGSST